MSSTPSELWIHCLSMLSHDIRTPMNSARGHTNLILQNKFGPVDPQQQRALEQVSRSLRVVADVWEGLYESSRARTLTNALAAAAQMLGHSFETCIPLECRQVPSRCASMPFILLMLLRSAQSSVPPEDRARVYAEMSCGPWGYQIVIAPDRTEPGSDWPDITATACGEEGWLAAAASELSGSGHSFTVRSNGRLSTFSIVFTS